MLEETIEFLKNMADQCISAKKTRNELLRHIEKCEMAETCMHQQFKHIEWLKDGKGTNENSRANRC